MVKNIITKSNITNNFKIYPFLIIISIIELIFNKDAEITRIFQVGNLNYRCDSFANSKNEMFLKATSYPNLTDDRVFFGIKNDGNFFFKDENENEIPNYLIKGKSSYSDSQNIEKVDSENLFIQLSKTDDKNNNHEQYKKEYYLSISSQYSYIELYDLDQKMQISQIYTEEFLSYSTIYSNIFSFFKQTKFTDKNYYILAFISNYNNNNYDDSYFNIKRFYFTSNEISSLNSYKIENILTISSSDRQIVSCFETEKGKIICFYQDTSYNFRVIGYDNMLKNIIVNITLEKETVMSGYKYNGIFFKCIHLKKEIGIFVFFISVSDLNPYIIFKNFDQTLDNNYNYDIEIRINQTDLTYYYKLNDILKINENKIAYISCPQNREKLYIIIINLFNDDTQFSIRYYLIEIFKKYRIKLYKDLRSNLFDKYITIAFSYCFNNTCDLVDHTEHNTSVIIFNYPNSSNFDIDIISQLNKTNEKISNITILFDNNIFIENNIFGLIYKGIKIISISENIKLYNYKNNYEILNEAIILKNESIILSITNKSNEIIKQDYYIQYSPIYTEPEYEEFNNYTSIIINSEIEKEFFENSDYIGKVSKIKIIIKNNLYTNCSSNELCSLCDSNNICIVCENEYKFNNNGEKICIQKNEIEIINKTIEINKDCDDEEVLNYSCNGKLTDYQISLLYNKLENDIINKNYSKNNTIVITENAIYQISTTEDQKNNNDNISSIDLGECGIKLRNQEGLTENDEDIIIYKVDIKKNNLTYVQYELFHPYTLQKLNLSICKNDQISISVPTILNSETENLYNTLSELGYNLFDVNDSFYTDICTQYTSKNGNDMTLNDRNSEILYNQSLCQNGCDLILYNSTSKKAICKCNVEETNQIISDTNNIKDLLNAKIVSNFYSVLKYSNIYLMKCYKLLFSSKGMKYNFGFFMVIIFMIFLIVLVIIYYVKDRKKISIYITMIIDAKKRKIKPKKSIKTKFERSDKKRKTAVSIRSCIRKNTRKEKRIKSNEIKYVDKNKNSIIKNIRSINTKNDKNAPPKKKKSKKVSVEMSHANSLNKNQISSNNYIIINNSLVLNKDRRSVKTNIKFNKEDKNPKSDLKKSKSLKPKSNQIYKRNNNTIAENNFSSKLENSINENFEKFEIWNDAEMNALKYEDAIKLDKRTYFQYYWSLVRKKQLILFTFYPANDYNLVSLKLSFFLLSFSLYFAVNALFFNDSTMHKIYIFNSNILYRLPQIFYSSLISFIINSFYRNLAESEKSILDLKKIKNFRESMEFSETIKKNLRIKFIIFYILNFLFMIFLAYFIGCFCAVYVNTIKILIIDTLISFATSMLYHFGVSLFPGLFRIQALRSKEKNKQCSYGVSKVLAVF